MGLLSNRKGLTLIEMLVVMALFGVLTRVIVPNYKRMQVKAKETEAVAKLGALAHLENAFYVEHGTYTNHLTKLGFDPQSNQSLFSVGFANAAGGNMAVAPSQGSYEGQIIQMSNAYFYANPTPNTVARRTFTLAENFYAGSTGSVGAPYNAVTNKYPRVGVSADGRTYVAAATGHIGPGSRPSDWARPALSAPSGTMKQGIFVYSPVVGLTKLQDPYSPNPSSPRGNGGRNGEEARQGEESQLAAPVAD